MITDKQKQRLITGIKSCITPHIHTLTPSMNRSAVVYYFSIYVQFFHSRPSGKFLLEKKRRNLQKVWVERSKWSDGLTLSFSEEEEEAEEDGRRRKKMKEEGGRRVLIKWQVFSRKFQEDVIRGILCVSSSPWNFSFF